MHVGAEASIGARKPILHPPRPTDGDREPGALGKGEPKAASGLGAATPRFLISGTAQPVAESVLQSFMPLEIAHGSEDNASGTWPGVDQSLGVGDLVLPQIQHSGCP